MKNALSMIALAVAGAGMVAACGGGMQVPSDRLASTDAAIRSARELGAQQDPQAALHLKLAEDQTYSARQLIKDGDNKRADLILQRAKSDAELSVMMTKENKAKADAAKANEVLNNAKIGK